MWSPHKDTILSMTGGIQTSMVDSWPSLLSLLIISSWVSLPLKQFLAAVDSKHSGFTPIRLLEESTPLESKCYTLGQKTINAASAGLKAVSSTWWPGYAILHSTTSTWQLENVRLSVGPSMSQIPPTTPACPAPTILVINAQIQTLQFVTNAPLIFFASLLVVTAFVCLATSRLTLFANLVILSTRAVSTVPMMMELVAVFLIIVLILLVSNAIQQYMATLMLRLAWFV